MEVTGLQPTLFITRQLHSQGYTNSTAILSHSYLFEIYLFAIIHDSRKFLPGEPDSHESVLVEEVKRHVADLAAGHDDLGAGIGDRLDLLLLGKKWLKGVKV